MMRRVGSAYLMIFVMLLFALPTFAQDATPEVTPEVTQVPAQDDYPALDATFCADGLQFKYPSSWYIFQPKPKNPNAQNLINAEVSTEKDDITGFSVYQSHGLTIFIDVYKVPQLLDLFRNQSVDEGGGYLFLSGFLKYFGETLDESNLEELMIPDGDHNIFRLRIYRMTDDITYTLLDSGVMIQVTFTLSAPYENPDPLNYTESSIFDTITYDPNTLCPSTEQK